MGSVACLRGYYRNIDTSCDYDFRNSICAIRLRKATDTYTKSHATRGHSVRADGSKATRFGVSAGCVLVGAPSFGLFLSEV